MSDHAFLLGAETNKFNVRISEGLCARVDAFPFAGHQLIFLDGPHRFRSVDNKERIVPDGVAFIQNKDLARRTRQRVTHQVVGLDCGVYDVFCALGHVKRGEVREANQLRETRQLTFDYITDLRSWKVLDDAERDLAFSWFSAQAEELSEPKRNDKKLRAGDRYRKAATLRTPRGKRAPMQTAFTASAGAHHIDKRREEAKGIALFFSEKHVKMWHKLSHLHDVLGDVWRFFDEASSPKHPLRLAAERTSGQTKRLARERLAENRAFLLSVRVRPYIELINRAVRELDELTKTLDEYVPKDGSSFDLATPVAKIRTTLRTIRLVKALITELIIPLSFLEKRWKMLPRAKRAEKVLAMRAEFVQYREHLQKAEDLDPETRQQALAAIEARIAAEYHVDQNSPRRARITRAKDELKKLIVTIT